MSETASEIARLDAALCNLRQCCAAGRMGADELKALMGTSPIFVHHLIWNMKVNRRQVLGPSLNYTAKKRMLIEIAERGELTAAMIASAF